MLTFLVFSIKFFIKMTIACITVVGTLYVLLFTFNIVMGMLFGVFYQWRCGDEDEDE